MAKKKAKKKARRPAKKAAQIFDGLGPKEEKYLVRAIRQVFGWSTGRRLCIARAKLPHKPGDDPFYKCEACGAKVAKVYADHIEPIGPFTLDYIERSIVPSAKLQATCKKCHALKTKAENQLRQMLEVE